LLAEQLKDLSRSVSISASRSIKSSTLTVLVKGKSMAWFFILFADLFEIAWPFVLKWATPFSRWAPLLVGVLCAVPVNYLLAEAVQRLPAATVYASFVGVATAGTAIVGMVLFGESTNAGRICSLALILLGLIGLKFFSDATE
jgi:quaternary ammonium compound-resistance protein SugE